MYVKKAFTVAANSNITIDIVKDFHTDLGVKRMNINSNGHTTHNSASMNGIKVCEGCNKFEFPIINGKSPSRFTLYASETPVSMYVIIEEFGGEANPNYFKEDGK